MFFFTLFIAFINYFIIICGQQLKLPCPKVLTIDITNGLTYPNGSIRHNNILFAPENYFKDSDIDHTIRGCVCNIKNCLRKCCNPQEKIIRTNCTKGSSSGLDLKFFEGSIPVKMEEQHYFLYSFCKGKKKALWSWEIYYLQKNGSVFIPHDKKQTLYLPEEYCVENWNYPELKVTNVTTVFLCLTGEVKIKLFSKYLTIGKWF